MPDGPTWIIAADGGGARFFYRERPGLPLREIYELAESADLVEHKPAEARPVHEHTGHGAHSLGARLSPHEEAEQHFIRHVAAQLDRAVAVHAIGRLAMCAPPRALGQLRDAVSAATRRKLICEIPKDIVRERVTEIDARLQTHRI